MKLELVGEITQYDMRIYQGVAGRGGTPYGAQSSFTLMKAAGETETAKEPEIMEPAEIPTEEPTEPEPIEEAEVVTEATPEEEPETPEEVPSEESVEEAVPEIEEETPEPVVEEEPEPAPPPEPEPVKDEGVTFTFNPESPCLTDGAEPLMVHGQIAGIVEPASTRFYVNVVRKGDNGTTIPVADAQLRPEGARTATSHSWVSNPQAY